jgi:hypothetical protein
MKIFSILQIIVICFSLIVILGVDQCPASTTTQQAGIGGLSASFVENAPPLNVVVNKQFSIYAEIKNVGDANVNPGSAKFYLIGLGQNVHDAKSVLQNTNLLGPGANERLDFATAATSTLDLVQPVTTPMLLTSCYKYGGKAQADVCIALSNQSSVCSLSAGKISYNSAEPIHISSFTETLSASKLQILFTIVNNGKGVAYLPDSDCDKLQARDTNEVLKSNQVKVRVGDLGGGFSCKLRSLESPYNSIEGLEGVAVIGTVVCEKDLSGAEEQKTALQINLDYVYVDTLSQSLLISPA